MIITIVSCMSVDTRSWPSHQLVGRSTFRKRPSSRQRFRLRLLQGPGFLHAQRYGEVEVVKKRSTDLARYEDNAANLSLSLRIRIRHTVF